MTASIFLRRFFYLELKFGTMTDRPRLPGILQMRPRIEGVRSLVAYSTLIYTPIYMFRYMFSVDWFISYAFPTLSEMEAAVLSIFILHQGAYMQ